jgi:hypothetical protein
MNKRRKRANKIKRALNEDHTSVNSFGNIEALRIISSEGRLLILWLLYERERSVSEIATKLQMSAVSFATPCAIAYMWLTTCHASCRLHAIAPETTSSKKIFPTIRHTNDPFAAPLLDHRDDQFMSRRSSQLLI